MKRFILFVTFAFLVIPAFSQVSIGITGGYSLAKYHMSKSYSSDYITNKFISTWHAGIIAEKKLVGQLYFQPQLLISRKGDDFLLKYLTPYAYNKIVRHTTYLELPLNFVYKFKISKGSFYVGAGPYIARGLGGKIDMITNLENDNAGLQENTYHFKIKFKKDPKNLDDETTNYMRPMDYGANFLGGYELNNGLFFNVNYSRGFRDVYEGGNGPQNRYLGLSVGYFLKRSK